VPTRKRVIVWYLAVGPLILLLLLSLLFLYWLFPDAESLNTLGFAATLLMVFSAPAAWIAALVAAIQHRREWPLVLPLWLFVLGGVVVTGSIFMDSGLAGYFGLALTLLAIGLATLMGWAPVLATPGDRGARIRALGAAALQAARRPMEALATMAGLGLIVTGVLPPSADDRVPAGIAVLLGVAILPVTWRWLSRATGWAVPVTARIAAVALLAFALAATSSRVDPRVPEPTTDQPAAGELQKAAEPEAIRVEAAP
jgi:hypothetical protein